MSNHTSIETDLDIPVEISVGEPWDFESPDGENYLKGIMIAKDAGDGLWALCNVTPFYLDGTTITQIVAFNRYNEKDQNFVKTLNAKKEVCVNMDYSLTGKKLYWAMVQDWLESDDPKSFLIGSIRIL